MQQGYELSTKSRNSSKGAYLIKGENMGKDKINETWGNNGNLICESKRCCENKKQRTD